MTASAPAPGRTVWPWIVALVCLSGPAVFLIFTTLAIGAAAGASLTPIYGPSGVTCTVTPSAAPTAAAPQGTAQTPTAAAATATPIVAAAGQLSGVPLVNARLIVATARALPVEESEQQLAAVITLMTAQAESGLLNLANPAVPASLLLPNDGQGTTDDSLGILQQRPSQGWGSPQQLMTPAYAATKFLTALLASPQWSTLPPWQAAQNVQASGDPTGGNYAAWASWATAAGQALWQNTSGSITCTSGSTPTTAGPVPAGPTGGVGNGAPLPAADPATSAAVIAYATAQLGKPYIWGATGPQGYDCSGLALASYASAGVTLPRTSEEQWNAAPAVPTDQLQPGDLVFFDPDPDGRPGHVGIYLGNGEMVDAPNSTTVVREEPVAGFGPYLGAVRPT